MLVALAVAAAPPLRALHAQLTWLAALAEASCPWLPSALQVIGRMEKDDNNEWADVAFVPAGSVAAAAAPEPAKKKK